MTQGADDQDWLGPRWARRLGRLADLGHERDPIKVRQRILENLDALCDACLCRTRQYASGKGEEKELYEVPDPDLKTALGAQLAGARMLGVDSEVKPTVDTSEIDELLRRAKRALVRQQTGRAPAEEPNAAH